MKPSADDPAFFTGSLWLMAPGSWEVHFEIDGASGKTNASVPVPAMPLSILPMQRSLGIMLALTLSDYLSRDWLKIPGK